MKDNNRIKKLYRGGGRGYGSGGRICPLKDDYAAQSGLTHQRWYGP